MRVAVTGESAGGNMAAVVCQQAIKEGNRVPSAQLLVYPVTDMRGGYASYDENQDTQPLHTPMLPWFFNYYLNEESEKQDPRASPILGNLNGLPPAIVITAEFDPLRDEGEAYAKQLADAGVSVKFQQFDGVTHEFFGLAGAVSKAKEAIKFAAEGLKEVFENKAKTSPA